MAGKTAEGWTRSRALSQGAFPIFLDPNRPLTHRRSGSDATGKEAVKETIGLFDVSGPVAEQKERLMWAIPKITPFRFHDLTDADGDPLDAVDVRTAYLADFSDEGMVKRLDPDIYWDKCDSARTLLRCGVRIEKHGASAMKETSLDRIVEVKSCGCWIPVDGQLSNNRYKDIFSMVYGIDVRKPENVVTHNLRDTPVGDGEQLKGRYKPYIGKSGSAVLISDLSHLCHNPTCIRPDHICIELKIINDMRKECDGPDSSGFCRCMKSFVRKFYGLSDQTDAAAFTKACQLVPHCLRSAKTVADIQRLIANKTVKSYSESYPTEAQLLLDGPFERDALGYKRLDDSVVKSRCKEAAMTLYQTGFRFMTIPYAFVDALALDNFFIEFNKARGKIEATEIFSATGAPQLTGRAKVFWQGTFASALVHIAARYSSLMAARQKGLEDYLANRANAALKTEREAEVSGADLCLSQEAAANVSQPFAQEEPPPKGKRKRRSAQAAEDTALAAAEQQPSPAAKLAKGQAPKPVRAKKPKKQ